MKIITDQEISEILNLINERRIIQVRKVLKNLTNDPLRDKLRTLIRNLGKSNMINKEEIEVLLKEDES